MALRPMKNFLASYGEPVASGERRRFTFRLWG
jgi:hypothetical protein